MTTPNISTITDSLERSLQNVSLNNHHPQTSSCSSSGSNGGGTGGAGDASGGGISRTSSSDLIENHQHDNNTFEISYELNSHIRMPYHWEQCLDLKTGELYYMNWMTGMKCKEDPRTTSSNLNVGFDDFVELDDESSYESEGSTTEESSSLPSSCEQKIGNIIKNESNDKQSSVEEEHVLVVAGCKNCYMYLMVPKQVDDCPKCTGQLIHFASP